jgi:low affinity Fe/Cu permease
MASKRTPDSLPLFACFARAVERQVGRSYTFVLAVGVVIAWAVSGPVFGWSDTWQLVINTGTTIITFLMVFVIQNTQSRDTTALHLKLDELIRVTTKARDSLVGVEDLPDKEIERARTTLQHLSAGANPPATRAPIAKAKRARRRASSSKMANGSKVAAAEEVTAPAR